MTRYRCVDAQKAAGFPVAAAYDAAAVSTSAIYAWSATRVQEPSARDQQETRLLTEIRANHARSRGTYGSQRMTAGLRRRGWRVNHKRVERLMRAHGIVGYRAPPAPLAHQAGPGRPASTRPPGPAV